MYALQVACCKRWRDVVVMSVHRHCMCHMLQLHVITCNGMWYMATCDLFMWRMVSVGVSVWVACTTWYSQTVAQQCRRGGDIWWPSLSRQPLFMR